MQDDQQMKGMRPRIHCNLPFLDATVENNNKFVAFLLTAH